MTELTQLEELLRVVKEPYTVVDFYGTFCGPCKAIAPHYAALARKYPNVNFVKVNVENSVFDKAVQVCKITSLPTFFFYAKGKYYCHVEGSNIKLVEDKVREMLQKR